MMPLNPKHFVDCIALNVGGEMDDASFREFVTNCLELYEVSDAVATRLKARELNKQVTEALTRRAK
jgi:hypothetical protein